MSVCSSQGTCGFISQQIIEAHTELIHVAICHSRCGRSWYWEIEPFVESLRRWNRLCNQRQRLPKCKVPKTVPVCGRAITNVPRVYTANSNSPDWPGSRRGTVPWRISPVANISDGSSKTTVGVLESKMFSDVTISSFPPCSRRIILPRNHVHYFVHGRIIIRRAEIRGRILAEVFFVEYNLCRT